MKKLFLFLSGALLSLGLSAQELYEVTISSWDFVMGGENNVEIQDQLGGAMLKSGDMIYLKFDGYFDADVEGVNVVTIVDNAGSTNYTAQDEEEDPTHKAGTPNYWIQLSAWSPENVGAEKITKAKAHFEAETIIELNADAASSEKIIVRCSPRTDADVAMIKMRPTASFAEGTTYSVDMPTIKFGADNPEGPTNYKAEFTFETSADLAVDDIVKITIDGKFNQDISGLNFMIFDNDGNTVLPWTSRPFEATKDEACTKTSFDFTITKAFVGTNYKVGVFIAGYDETKEIKFLKDGDVEHEPVEVAKKDYTEMTLAYNQYATPANYQFIEASIAENVLVGDYVTFSVTGKASAAFTKMIAYVRNATSYSAVSGQVVVAENVAADGTVEYSGTVEITAAVEGACDLVFEITDEATEGSSIYVGEGEPYVAVELASKAYTNVSLALNEWDGGSNYQYVEELVAPTTGFNATDYVTYSIKGVASEAIEGLQVYLMDDKYTAVSEYKIVQENIEKDGTVDVEGKIELTKATDVCKFVIVTTDAKKDGVASITIGEAGSQDAVEEVSAVSFINGVVYSAGKIEVYNVAGQIEEIASQQFDTKSLNSGVYFITTPEGTIKIQK